MMTELNKFGGRGEERLSARTTGLTKRWRISARIVVYRTTVPRVLRTACLCIPW